MSNKNLGIAYNMKRKSKKMAEGGAVSVPEQKRPMPESEYNDSKDISNNSSAKHTNDSWIDPVTVKQAQAKGGVMPSKRPRMVEGVLNTKLRDMEGRLIESIPPSSPKQPDEIYNEKDAKKEGANPDMSNPHSAPKSYAKGGKINDTVSMSAAEDDMAEHPAHLEEDDDQRRPMMKAYMSDHEEMLAEGGLAGGETDSYDDDGKQDSIAAAIMSRRDREHAKIDSGARDEDLAAMYAEGGEILDDADMHEIKSHGSMDSDDSDQADLSRNADEDANEEDQASFNALRKENYSESEGLRKLSQPTDSNLKGDDREDESENKQDRVSAIRSRMMAKRQFKR